MQKNQTQQSDMGKHRSEGRSSRGISSPGRGADQDQVFPCRAVPCRRQISNKSKTHVFFLKLVRRLYPQATEFERRLFCVCACGHDDSCVASCLCQKGCAKNLWPHFPIPPFPHVVPLFPSSSFPHVPIYSFASLPISPLSHSPTNCVAPNWA